MISLSPEDFADGRSRGKRPGFKIQDILLECDPDSRSVLVNALMNADFPTETISKRLRLNLSDTKYQGVSGKSVDSWRENASEWLAELPEAKK